MRIAAERVLQARALYGITRSEGAPFVDAVAGVNAVRASREGASGALPAAVDTDFAYFEAGFDLQV